MYTYPVEETAGAGSIVKQEDQNKGPTLPPWPTPYLWGEVNQSLAHHVRLYHDHLIHARGYAWMIRQHFQRIFPLMDELCRETCCACEAVCCRHAKPWYDLKDLIYLHLCELTPPAGQPIGHASDRCRYLTENGCELERDLRPWICTWYICPDQIALLGQKSKVQRYIIDTIFFRIKTYRNLLEKEFVHTVSEGILSL